MAENEAESGGKASKKKPLIVGLIIFIILTLLGGVGGAYFLMKSGKKDEPHETSSTSASTEAKSDGDKAHEANKEKSEHPKSEEDKNSEHGKNEEHGNAGDHGKKDEHGNKDEHGKAGGEGGKTDEHGSKEGGKALAANTTSAKEETITIGETFTLKPFHLNLGNPLENRYIRLEISIEYKGGEPQKKELELRTSQLRDVVISVVSRKTREFILGADGKDQLRLEILNRVNQYLDRKVESIFITDLIVE